MLVHGGPPTPTPHIVDLPTDRVNFPQQSGHSCCLLLVVGEVLLVLDWWPVFQGAVQSLGVVPVEPLEHRGAGLGSGGEVFVVDELSLQEAKNDSAMALS